MTETREGTRLAGLFADHVVLQRDRPIPIWGWDAPGQTLTLKLRVPGESGELCAASGEADANGRFQVRLPPCAAGGPYDLYVEGRRQIVLHDVWIGEVWLASGQSNMEWKVAASLDAEQEIARANWPAIRVFKVAASAAQAPQRDAGGTWSVCSPETAGDFSAVGYFFARELVQARSVPVGIIDATWGGTCIEAWTSLEALAPVLPDLDAQRASLAAQLVELPRVQREYERVFQAWQREHLPGDEKNQGLARGFARPDCDDASWSLMPLPGYWQARGMKFNGVVWFRRSVDIPESFAGQELTLHLGAIDDFDDTYFEGEAVGKTPPGTPNAHQVLRRYRLPAGSVKSGSRVIAVRVFDHFGNGGFAGPTGEMFLERSDGKGERVPLNGRWRYQVEREVPLVPMDVFQTAPPLPVALALHNSPASLFHGMLAPLVPYALRGAIWYQGESNTARASQYRALQVALIRDLRTRFAQGQFPFYYVQLANYRASLDWARLREAQSDALSEPETGMVISLDIGDSQDIHPKNKQEVARRLSLLARSRTYGERELVADSPRVERVSISGREVRVRFAHARGLCTADGGPVRGFALAGPLGRFELARAQIVGDEVWLEAPGLSEPRAVRYAWADDPDANLQNGAGLPAAPFRSDGFAA
ncbi:MAG TPA: sialate O-acetylesterase [Polyangiaceae bacterium]|nr:sialate O-acetylesterase [Polyangiaceae bacterium]